MIIKKYFISATCLFRAIITSRREIFRPNESIHGPKGCSTCNLMDLSDVLAKVRCYCVLASVAFIAFIAYAAYNRTLHDNKNDEEPTMHTEAPPTLEDRTIAREASTTLAHYAQRNLPLTLKVESPTSDDTITLPEGAIRLLLDILGAMAAGKAITIIPKNHELSTVEAAELLNVSRPFLIKLLEASHIPYRTVGRHRRIRIEDVLHYKQQIDEQRRTVLDTLVSEAQALDMGYD